MTKSEWLECVAVLQGCWSNYRPSEEDVRATYAIIGNADKDEVMEAIVNLSKEGREFAPPVGVILQRAQAKYDHQIFLPFAQAMRLIERAVGKAHTDERKALEWLESESPVVARWVVAYGYEALRMEPVADPDKGSMICARLEKSYESSCTAYREERADGWSIAQARIMALGGREAPTLGSGVVAKALAEVREKGEEDAA